jgi:hypothetical protein
MHCVPTDISYLVYNRRDRRPRCFNNVIFTIDHSLVTFLNEEYFAAQVNPHSYHSPDSSIHACNQPKFYIIWWEIKRKTLFLLPNNTA